MYDNEAKMNVGGALRGRTLQGPGLGSAQEFDAATHAKLAQAQQESYGNAAQRQPEIFANMSLLASALKRLTERSHELNARLGCVLRPVPPDADNPIKAEQSPQTALGQAIHEQREQVDYVDRVLIQILQNIEI